MYEEGHSLTEIGMRFRVSRKTIAQVLQNNDIEIRKRGDHTYTKETNCQLDRCVELKSAHLAYVGTTVSDSHNPVNRGRYRQHKPRCSRYDTA